MTSTEKVSTAGGIVAFAVGGVLLLSTTDKVIENAAVPLPPQPKAKFVLRWDAPDIGSPTGYNIYISANKDSGLWVKHLTVAATNASGITNITYPVWLRMSSLENGQESLMSEIIGVLGEDKIVTIWAEATTNIIDGNWLYIAPVLVKTNPTETQEFYRLGISNKLEYKIEHE